MTEQVLHKKVCDYIQEYYPNVYFDSDPSGVRVSVHTARLLKATRSAHAHLDITILKRSQCGRYSGLILELKADTPFKLNGELKTSEHISDQLKSMIMLREEGFRAEWCWSEYMAKELLLEHLGEPVQDNTPLFPL